MKAAVFGASGGIGKALIAELAGRETVSDVQAYSRRATESLLPKVCSRRFDLTHEDSIAALATNCGPLDLVIVATGALTLPGGVGPEKSLRALDPAAMAQAFALNTIGPAMIAKHFLPKLPRDSRAVFAVLSARVGSIGDNRLGGWHSYRASKAALNMLMRNAAIELRRSHPLSIVVTLHPGTVATELSASFLRGIPDAQLFTPVRSAQHLLAVIDGLEPAQSGGFFGWDGVPIPD